jgi:PII-like signaling protein
MTDEYLALTAYFGERKRTGRRLVADALLDLYAREAIATSSLMRGLEGFGLRHHLRSDSLLTLSEDLPAVAVAVDRRARVESLVDEVVALVGQGLVTVNPADVRVADSAAARLTVYLRRQQRIGGRPAHVAVCELLDRRGVEGATTLLGVDGTLGGLRQRARFFGRNPDVPVAVIAIGSSAHIAGALPDLQAALDEPLVTTERVELCKRDGAAVAGLVQPAAGWCRLTVYTSEAQLYRGRPIHREITRRLRTSGARGVTTLRGIWGFHAPHAPHGERVTKLGRHVPVVTTVIDTADRIAPAYEVIDELTVEHGLVTSQAVQVLS